MPGSTTGPGPWPAIVAPPDAVLPIPSPTRGAVTLPWTTLSSCGEEEGPELNEVQKTECKGC